MPSPLEEAKPESIDILFSKNPEEISDEEIQAMVGELRKQRTFWQTTEKAKVEKPKLDIRNLDDLLKDL